MVVKGARGAGQGPEEESSIVERARGGGGHPCTPCLTPEGSHSFASGRFHPILAANLPVRVPCAGRSGGAVDQCRASVSATAGSEGQ